MTELKSVNATQKLPDPLNKLNQPKITKNYCLTHLTSRESRYGADQEV